MTENETKVLNEIRRICPPQKSVNRNFKEFAKSLGLSQQELDEAIITLEKARYITEFSLAGEDNFKVQLV